jgi:hypothetical protein
MINNYDNLAFIENTYNCMGICQAPFFYITKDIFNGKPEPCLPIITNSIETSFKIVGIFCVAAGGIFCISCCCLCSVCAYKEDEEEEEKEK